MVNWWEDVKTDEKKTSKDWWEDVKIAKPLTPSIEARLGLSKGEKPLIPDIERIEQRKAPITTSGDIDTHGLRGFEIPIPKGKNLFEKYIFENDAESLKRIFGFDLDKIKSSPEAFKQAQQDATNYDFTQIKRWNTIKDNAEKGNGFTKFFDKISQAGASAFMGEKIPEHYKINSGSKIADVGADIIGTIGGFATPVGGTSLLSAGQQASQGLIPKITSKASPTIRKAISSPLGHRLTEGAIMGGVVDVGQGVKEGDNAKQLVGRTIEGAVFGAGLDVAGYGIGKLAPKLKDLVKSGVLQKIEAYADEGIESTVKEAVNPPKVQGGKFKLKNIELEKAYDNYNQAIYKIQDHFGTNQLRADEMPLIKSELGIDLDSLVDDIAKAEAKTPMNTLKEIGERQRLAKVAGVVDTQKPKIQRTGKLIPEIKAMDEVAATSTSPLVPEIQTDETSFRSKIDRSPVKKTRSFKEIYDKVRTSVVDDAAPLENLEKNIKGKVDSAENSIYKQARLFKGAPERANEIVRTELEPIIKSVESAGYDYKDLGDYALAVHARDVNAAGIESGFTNEEIEEVIQKLGTPEIEKARKQLINLSNNLLDDLVENGVLSQDGVNAMRGKWKNYMPMFRSFDDEKVEFTKGLGDSFANIANPIKRLKGSQRKVVDPIENMIKNIYKTTNTTARNKVGLQLSELNKLDVDNNFIRMLDKGEEVGRKNVVNVYENGQKVGYEVQPEIYTTMLNLDKESSNTLIRVLSKPASALRAGATLTPEFALRNPMRDIQNAFVVSKSGFNPITDFASGLISTIKKDASYSDFLKHSGGYGNILSMDRQKHREVLKKTIKQPVTEKYINVMSPKGFLELLRSISDVTESATKLGEYKAALRQGQTPQEAAYRARDLMDFARAGSSIRPANRVVAFLNANIQGKSKLIRAIKEDPKRVTGKMIVSMGLPSIGAYVAQKTMANDKQREIIKDAPNWLRDTYWLVPVPGTNQIARIPKPFDISAISNVTERALEYLYDNDEEAFDGFARTLLKENGFPVMLTGIVPIIEGMTNYSFFRESSIIPLREQYIKKSDQYDINTSEAAKAIAKPMSKLLGEDSNFASPRIIDNTIYGLTGGLGKYATNAIDFMLEKTGVVEEKNRPAKAPSQLPVAKAFLVNEASSGKSMDFVYSELDKLKQERGSAKLKNEKFVQLPKLKYLEKQTKKISGLSKEIRNIKEDKSLLPKVKRDRVLDLIDKRNNIARETKKYVKKRDKELEKKQK